MVWTLLNLLFLLTWKLAACDNNRGRSLSKTYDVSNNTTYRSAAYYVNWAIYARKFNPQDLPVDQLTHVLYAFANISPSTGEVYLSDTWADTEIHFAGDSWDEAGTNLYGCFKQLYLLKKANRNLKVLLSIGGSSYSTNFATPVSTDSGRLTFASSAVSLVGNLGLDGLDIDWEYPQNDAEAGNMVLLLQAIREALDAYGSSLSTPYHFQLTVACPAGPSYYETLHLADMDPYVDFWNLMAYDYAGSWSSVAANQANLFPSTSDLASTPFNTEDTIGNYTLKGIAASKILLGMPVYGRSFAATDGLGKTFNADSSGTWQPGVYDFKALSLDGPSVYYDNTTGSSYSYNATTRELISYDNVAVAIQKALWIQQMGLGGAMWWESSADRVGNNSLIQNVVEVLGGDGGSGLENSPNQLLYPNSTYDNIRAGMPGSGSSAAISPTTSETASAPSKSVQGGDSSSGFSPTSTSADGMDSSPTGSATPTQFTTSTVQTTSVSTVISCASTVKNCPAHSTILTTLTIDISTTICPVTETSSESISVSASSTSGQSLSETSLPTQTTTFISFDTVSSSPAELSCSEIGSTGTTTRAVSEKNTQSSITSTLTIPGKDGVPTCAYILATDLGDDALCSLDYCNCGGTVAPLLTSSTSGTLITNCNYETQPAANSCPTIFPSPSTSSITQGPPTIITTTTLPTPPLSIHTVTSVVVVTKRDGFCRASMSTPGIIDTSSVSTWTFSSLALSTSSSTPATSSTSSPSPSPNTLSSTYSTLSAPSTSSSAPSTLSSTSSILSASSTTSSSSSMSASGSGCKTGATCESYNLLKSSSGTCFCGLDANNDPTCFGEYTCLKSCTTNADCATGEACLVQSCCPPKKENCNLNNFRACHIYTGGSTCAPLAAGCLNSA